MKTLYVDIDSTIWPLNDYMHDAMLSLTGIHINHEDVTTWDYYFNLGVERELVLEAFDIALSPDKVADRPLYDGVADALLRLSETGFHVHFLSHNPCPKPLHDAVYNWLMSKLMFPYSLTIFGARNCKVAFMREDSEAYGIIEDKPSTLIKAHKSEFVTIAKRQPWNLTTIEEYGIMSFDAWREVPKLVTGVERVD